MLAMNFHFVCYLFANYNAIVFEQTPCRYRYSTLGAAEINSSDDNKVATYALLDKVGFDRQRYRLGHTIIFFRAGALAALEEVT